MAQLTTIKGFYGVLGQVEFSDRAARIRLYPFSFDFEALEPVLEVRIDEPKFAEEILKPLLYEEVEAEFGPSGMVVEGVWKGLSIELHGDHLTASFGPYSLGDYVGRVKKLSKALDEEAQYSRKAHLKLGRLKTLLAELMRRAEIKAGASEIHRSKQHAAIEVIRRIQAELEVDD
ncbi:hypothetical protein [Asticcacaulis tiandongensis]|uniref:hypothetical protein n=1 Tax=Asticcacaulis tiandongensis TaxID=2565365 RepID=UPI00112E9379|nr:hypothetical protein [Asticcacaulis tiandongensis]